MYPIIYNKRPMGLNQVRFVALSHLQLCVALSHLQRFVALSHLQRFVALSHLQRFVALSHWREGDSDSARCPISATILIGGQISYLNTFSKQM